MADNEAVTDTEFTVVEEFKASGLDNTMVTLDHEPPRNIYRLSKLQNVNEAMLRDWWRAGWVMVDAWGEVPDAEKIGTGGKMLGIKPGELGGVVGNALGSL